MSPALKYTKESKSQNYNNDNNNETEINSNQLHFAGLYFKELSTAKTRQGGRALKDTAQPPTFN